jgi:thiol-disulfide isomerase/thioredoxin
MKKIFVLIFLTSVLVSPHVCAQNSNTCESKPCVGQPMPDFKLTNVKYFHSTSASLQDFKGKWLFLDFWFTGCATCIKSFPHASKYSDEFKNEINWVMVGLNNNRYPDVEQFYEKFRKKYNLELISSYDSLLSVRWGIRSMPHIIVVNPEGIVYAITGGHDLSSEKIKALIKGEKVKLNPKDPARVDFEADSLMNYKDKILYQSVLTKWNGEMQWAGIPLNHYLDQKLYKKYTYKFAMVPLITLYKRAYVGLSNWELTDTAYYGKFYPKLLLEVKDSSLFDYDFGADLGKGTYNYSLSIPETEMSRENLMKYMQDDLHRYFKFETSLETRTLPVWKLVATKNATAKLKSKGGATSVTEGNIMAGFTFRNYPAKMLLLYVSFCMIHYQPPFIDETGLQGNIDFTIDADMTSIEDVRRELRKQGLDLVRDTREMKAIVIRDPGTSP